MKFINILFAFCFYLAACGSAYASFGVDINYQFYDEPIDVVIPTIEKDLETLDLCIAAIKKYGKSIRNVYVVSAKQLTEKAIWFDEKNYPFRFTDIAQEIFQDKKIAKKFLKEHKDRIGWVYQQLLKLYAPLVIPNISSNVLVLDSDTIFLNPVSFMNEKSEPLFNPGAEYFYTYFDHAERLIPRFHKVFQNFSGICHHMLFQKSVILHLFDTIKLYHNTEPWKAFCNQIDWASNALLRQAASEYEIYFNFIFSTTPQAHLRTLKWANVESIESIEIYRNVIKYHYISCHKRPLEMGLKKEE